MGLVTASRAPNRVKGMAALLLTVGLAIVSACGGSSSSSKVSPVNIGVIAGFTGSYVSFSDELLNGVQVAAALINQSGGINGGQVNVIPVNDGLDPVDAVPAVQKMLATDNVQLEAGLAALDYTAGLPLLNKAHMVSVSYIGPDYGPQVMPYHWNMNPSDSQLGLAMSAYAKSKGYKRIAVVFDTSLGAQSIVPSVKEAAQKLGLQIVASPVVPENVTSYQTAISQVVAANPDAVLLQVEPAQAGAFFQQWQSQGGGALPIIGTDVTLDQEWLKAVGAKEASHVTSIEGVQRTSSPFYTNFVNTWATVVNHPFSYVGSFLYDGTIMAALAMVDAKSTDPTVYYKYIDDVTLPGNDKTTIYSYADGIRLLKAGVKIKYSGITGPLVFNQYHRPTGDYGAYTGAVGSNPVQIAIIKADDLVSL